ncbi:MAG TPA: hypothetical protein VFQ53_10510 [Kofleriaceae bacterium]|nr:hypothetical protein [Kofleriaceae bacterium]
MRNQLLALVSTLTAAIAGQPSTASACTMPSNARVHVYWTTARPTSGDDRCTVQIDGTLACHLSGWLITPTLSTGSNLPALVYVHGSGKAKSTSSTCELVSYYTSRGYVVWMPYMRGVGDKTGGVTPSLQNSNLSAGFQNTGAYIDDWSDEQSDPSGPNYGWYTAALRGLLGPDATLTTKDYKAITTIEYMDDEVGDVQAALTYLVGQPGLNGLGKLVDPNRIALTGHSYGGVTVVRGSAQPLTPMPKLVVDMSGGALSWNSSRVWSIEMRDSASQHQYPLMAQIVEGESTAGTLPADEVYDAAQTQRFIAKYSTFTLSTDDINDCNAQGYTTEHCKHVHFMTDFDQVQRWAPGVRAVMQSLGI